MVDIQGSQHVSNKGNIYISYTDPQLHSVEKCFGRADRGKIGFDKFFSTHKCNFICKELGLKLRTSSSSLNGSQKRNTTSQESGDVILSDRDGAKAPTEGNTRNRIVNISHGRSDRDATHSDSDDEVRPTKGGIRRKIVDSSDDDYDHSIESSDDYDDDAIESSDDCDDDAIESSNDSDDGPTIQSGTFCDAGTPSKGCNLWGNLDSSDEESD